MLPFLSFFFLVCDLFFLPFGVYHRAHHLQVEMGPPQLPILEAKGSSRWQGSHQPALEGLCTAWQPAGV